MRSNVHYILSTAREFTLTRCFDYTYQSYVIQYFDNILFNLPNYF